MSVNITVNGKFAKHCRSHPLLNDPQEVRKAEEKERRKLRLLQVREESKKLAKKIRDEVNEEKKRELQKLQVIKEKELECWRQHALQRKGEEYREAIFQIGTAHQAARRENEEKADKQKTQGSYKDFKKQMAARKSQAAKVKFSCSCQEVKTSANKQYKCSCTQTKVISKEDEAGKRKRNLSFSSSESECEDEGFKEQTTIPQNSLSISSSSSSLSFDSSLLSISNNANNKTTQTSMFVPCNTNKCLIKTPAVYLDVEVGSEDSITISAPCEVKDKHVEYNREFNSVIRVSPRKGHKQTENTSGNTAFQQTSTTTTSSETTAIPVSDSKSSSKHQQVTKEKRFTIISDLVKKQQENVNNQQPTCQLNKATNSQATSATVTPLLSPRKQLPNTNTRPPLLRPQPVSPRKTSATSKSSRVVTDNTQPSTTFTATTKSNTAIPSACSSSGRVQFYDYNSKLAKERDLATTAVSVKRQRDLQQPTAMEQAELEKEKEREKQMEALRKSQQMEERGQKALEREQVRRDCHELTEKLEALTREYPNHLPPNDNHVHLFADKQLRKEGKMNSAVEKLLQRPTIITCSELKQPLQEENKPPQINPTRNNFENAINVANLNNEALSLDDVSSSDSCCSILIGYVDDQSRLVKQDLQNNNSTQSQTKQKRLKNLLKRLDDLRSSLIQELKNDRETKDQGREKETTKFSGNEENLRQVIDKISEMRKEREDILIKDPTPKDKPLHKREKELQAKEAILEQKVKEFYELKKQQNKTLKTKDKKLLKYNSKEDTDDSSSSKTKTEETNDKENKICVKGENPLEIIITVKGEAKSVPQKSKRKVLNKKSPSKLATLIKSPQTKKYTPKKKLATTMGVLKRQNSYDSNSTSYMSLPAEIPNKINDLAQQITQEKQKTTKDDKKSFKQNEEENKITSTQNIPQESETSLEPLEETLISQQQPARINPLIAQYVQRLLGMSRKAVEKLGVSSSEIDTPGSSVINTTENVLNSDTLISEERLISIHNFMEENKSFIKELEQSIRSQNNVTLENSMRKFDDIWQKRLKTENDTTQKKPKTQINKTAKENKPENKLSTKTKPLTDKKLSKGNTQQPSSLANKPIEHKLSSNDLLKDLGRTLTSHCSSDDRESLKSLKNLRKPLEKVDKAIETKLSTDSSSKAEPDSQIARYAKLTENCTHRIAELTELINRVRQEKQRLLEVTLSSVSDNGRQSTEYLELPEGKSSTRNEPDDTTRVSSSSSAESTTQTKQTQSSDLLQEITNKLSSQDKNKQITASRDSGLADSRPVTAQEHHNDPEPISQSTSESLMMPPPPPPLGRKLKPPPTLKRFSPQLPEDELAHELSTILEVDTPATSRINTAAGQSTEDRENLTDNVGPQQPIKFPTFEQYMKQLDLDITQMDPEQSMQLQQEFTTFLECLQQQRSPGDHPPKYSEFPSINAYIHRLAEGDNLGETLEESLAQLRISSIPSRNFPAVREYMKNNASKSTPEDQQLLDTESLENITEEPTPTTNNTDNDTASLDIEAELKRRKILKNSFRFSETKKQQIFSSTAHRDAAFYQDIIAIESGVDKLSSTGNTSELLDQDLRRMVQQWPGEVKKKSKEIKILSSTTTSANASALANSALRAASLDDSSKGTGQALNLREFLTRELLKHANLSGSIGSNSSSDDSLRSHFLHSLIGSLTPRTPGAASKSGALTLDRQKTSTPVPMHSTQTHSTTSSRSNTSSQLFSGESRLSSVHYQDRSVRFFTSDAGANADHSSE